jgi:PAS domain S-box-containing protein
MEKLFEVTIADRKLIAEGTYEMSFDFGDIPFDFLAGQYVWIKLSKLIYPDERGEVRAFSIASSPSVKNKVTIVFRKSESGFKRTLLELPVGTKVSLSGPFGSRLLPRDSSRPLVFVAGGVGIAPFLCMIRWATETNLSQQLHLLYANQNTERTAYSEDIFELKDKNPNFTFTSKIGPITEEDIDDIRAISDNIVWYISGPKEMVHGMARMLAKKGITEENLKMEEFHYSPGSYNIDQTNETDLEKDLLGMENFRLAIENASDHIVITDADGIIYFANKAAEKITGYKISEMLGQTPRLWGGMMSPEFYKNLWITKKVKKESFEGEITNRRKTGEIYLAKAKIAPILSKEDSLIGFVATEEDITKEREIDQAKTEFVALASHQLKTPLSAINWSIEGMMADKKSKLTEKEKKTLGDVYKMSQQMGDLVVTLLDISKIQLGTFVIELKETDLSTICEDVLRSLEGKIESGKIKIDRQYSEKFVMQTDPRLIKIVIQNLISNAIKYGKSAGRVSVGIEKSDGQVLIQVLNEGVAIPQEEQPMVFERFFRAAETKGIEGTGLGLYMTKEIVEKLGGKIWFKSGPEIGTTFYVSLPANKSEEKTPA